MPLAPPVPPPLSTTSCTSIVLQSTARRHPRRRRCSTRAATSRRCPPSGRPWLTWRPSAPQVGALGAPGGYCLLWRARSLCGATGKQQAVLTGVVHVKPHQNPHIKPHRIPLPLRVSHFAHQTTQPPAGATDRADYQEHAQGLGAGPAGLLGFSESAIRAVSCSRGHGRGMVWCILAPCLRQAGQLECKHGVRPCARPSVS